MIVCIVGPPGAGKTYLGEMMALTSGTALLSTDSLIPLGWSGASQAAAARITTTTGDLIVEGVAVARSLRYALDATDGAPCAELIYLRTSRRELTARQEGMAAGIRSVLAEIWDRLVERGVRIVDRCGVAITEP